MAFKFSISGLRGVVGKDLFPETVLRYAFCFGRFVGPGRVVIGRDTRASGKAFRKSVIDGLNRAGHPVIDLGVVPTPTVLFMVRKLKAAAGIVITASHNPSQWNALKFVSSKGIFLNAREFDVFSRSVAEHIELPSRTRQRVSLRRSGLDTHIQAIVSNIRPLGRPLRVGVDAVNAAGSIGLPRVLERMGCKVCRLHCRFGPVFPRGPEPVAKNIVALCRFVRKHNLDIGLACDPDCDRLAIVDEQGRPINEENTLVLACDHVLGHKKGPVVTNLSTTALVDHVAAKHAVKLYRTKVGEANVVSKMAKTSAVIGGEGNGGVIYPAVNPTRDALVAAAIVVRFVSEQGMRMSDVIAAYPRYYMVKKKVAVSKDRFEEKKQRIIDAFPGRIGLTDGLKITGDGYWVHVRPSQTEHVVRVIAESKDRKVASDLAAKVQRMLGKG